MIWFLLYVLCSFFTGLKQYQTKMESEDAKVTAMIFAVLMSPIWFICAFIRQFIVRDWT